MTDPTYTPDERREMWRIALGGLLAAVAICLWYRTLDLPIYPRDNQHYFYIGERVSAGLAPHASGFDPKSVVPLLLVGAATWLGDRVGIGPLVISRVVSILCYGILLGAAGVAAWQMTRRRAAALVTILILMACTSLPYMAAAGSQPKIPLTMFMALALVAAFARRPGWCAFFGTLAFLSWQPALMLVAAAGVVALLSRDRWRAVGRTIVAFVVPVGLYQLYFWLQHATAEQIEQEYVFPTEFMTHQWNGLATHIRWVMMTWHDGYGRSNPLPYLFPLLLLFFAGWLWQRRKAVLPAILDQPAWLYFAGLMLGTAAFTVYDQQGPPDFFFPIAYAAIAFGAATPLLLALLPGERVRQAALGLASVFLLFLSLHGRSRHDTTPYRLPAQRKVAAEVGRWLRDGRTIYAINAHDLLALNRATNWSRYNSFFRGVDEYLQERTGNKTAWVPTDSLGRLPDIILLGRAKPYGWPEWLQANGYQDVTPRDWRIQQLRVWERNGVTEVPQPAR